MKLKLDSPEYTARRSTAFTPVPPTLTIAQLRAAIPKHVFERSTTKSLYHVARHIALMLAFAWGAYKIEPVTEWACREWALGTMSRNLLDWALWCAFWFWQSVAMTGLWTLGHECGHDALSPVPWVNSVLGLFVHTSVLTPYFAWRITHQKHHKKTNNLHHEETYYPFTRSDLRLPPEGVATKVDYKHMIEETPGFSLFKMVIRQFLGFQLYLIHNRKGNPKYPPGTSHYKPSSKLFKPSDRPYIIISNIFMIAMLSLLTLWTIQRGFREVWTMYWFPWLWAHNWIITFTYLQHSDPTVPYYRGDEWTFTRGALATVDRPVFGWIGRFFWHNVAHDHVAHHFFVNVPFYNLEEATEAIKPLLGEHYYYDSTPTLYALWRSFTQCTFIEPKGDIVFFKNQAGDVARDLKSSEHVKPQPKAASK